MLTITKLHINHLSAPAGVTGPAALTWALESDRRNVIQKAYQIQIFRRGEFSPGYDTGMVSGSQSVDVPVSVHWADVTPYTVRVRVWAGDEISDWREASFVTGFQNIRSWRGKFVSVEPEADWERSYGTLLRKEFTLSKPVKEAWLASSAHGIYHCQLNGQRVTADELSPGWTSYNKRLLYQTWEVTKLLRPGGNVLGVMLGAGWYKGLMGYKHNRNLYGTRTAFGGQILVRYEDGSEEWIVSDESWRGSKGPVLFSEIYDGETYDARLEQPGWNLPGFDGSGWSPVETVEQDLSTLFPQSHPPIREMERITPTALLTTPQGDKVLDFSQNLSGWCEFTVDHPKAGDVVELRFFETLDVSGNVYTENLRGAKQILRYICKGSDRETYRPWFTFQGFQYAQIISWPGEASTDHFTAHAAYSALKQTGSFRCSNSLINGLWHNILWGMKGNFVDIPTDCPQRDERLGWTGDINVFSRTAGFLMDIDAFCSKWLADTAADQNAAGAVPHVIPDVLSGHMESDWLLENGFQGGASGWGDVAVCLPWELYLAYGDKTILERQLDSMLAWTRYQEERSDGCLFKPPFQFGDWLALDSAEGDYKGATPDDYSGAAWYCRCVHLMSRILHVVGRNPEADVMAQKAAAIKADFQRRFFTEDGTLTVQTQTAHVLALAFGLVPEQFRARITAGLKKLLNQADGHLTTGFMGTPFLAAALSENGLLDDAYGLVLKEDFPSWLYQVKQGATTVWEHWDGKRPDGSMWSAGMNSFNHYAYGSIGEWLVRTVAGLEVDEDHPGYEHFYIRPQLGGGLTWAELNYGSVRGNIAIRWDRSEDVVTLKVTIPANTTATLQLMQAAEILDSGELVFTGSEAQAESGQYVVRYQLK